LVDKLIINFCSPDYFYYYYYYYYY